MAFMSISAVRSAPAPLAAAGARSSFSTCSASPPAAASLVFTFSPALRSLHVPISAHAQRNSSDASTSLPPPHPPQLLTTPFEASPARSSILRLPAASDLSHLKTPSLQCTFPALVHADYHVVKEPCDAWIDAVAQPPSASASLFLHDSLLPLFVCRLFPTSISRQRLLHAIKAIAWLMIADDDDDHPDVLGSDYTTTAHRAGLVMAILRTPQHASSDSGFDCSFLADSKRPGFANKFANMLKALAKLWQEICQEMPPTLKARFISTMADYFEGIKVQASFREQANIPDVQSYIEIRRQASFTIPIFVLMEYALGIELDEPTFYNSLIHELRNAALDYISLCNDILSCPIEIGMGDYFNLPFILYNSSSSPPSCSASFQNAVDHVAQMAKDLDNRALFLISSIRDVSKNLEPSTVTAIHAYIDGLSLCMSGALAWFHETARYKKVSGRTELQQVAMIK